jgi:hypothetical protein
MCGLTRSQLILASQTVVVGFIALSFDADSLAIQLTRRFRFVEWRTRSTPD